MQINAFQRVADVVMQKSLREGFGLTVSEGLWKGRPVVGGRGGGITLQIGDGCDGYLVDSVEECARTHHRAARRPGRRRRDGRAGREHVRDELPLDPRARGLAHGCSRELRDRDRRLAPGPFRFVGRATTAPSSPPRGPGGLVGTLHAPGPSLDALDGDTWIAAAIGDDDRRGAATRRSRTLGIDLALPRPRPAAAPPALRRRRRTGCCGSCFHGLFDLPRRPRFDEHVPRSVGRVRAR